MKGKKRIIAALLIFVLVLSLAACSSNSPSAGDAGGGSSSDGGSSSTATDDADDWTGLELKFVSNYTAETSTMVVIQHWMDRVEEETDGKIKTTFFGGDTLMKSTDQFPGLLDGVADVILTDTSYNAEYWPLSRAYTLPGLIVDNSIVSTYAASEFIRTSDYPEFNQVKMMWALGLDTPGFMGNKPITKLEDFKGLQVRTNSFSKDPIEALGATAVALPAPEVYEALLKGTVDTNIMGFAALIDWKLDEVTKYEIVVPGITNTFHYCAMNIDVWNSIPKKYQDAIEKVNDECVGVIAPIQSEMTAKGMKQAEEKGLSVTTIEGAELERILEQAGTFRDEWIADMEAKGEPGQEVWDKLVALVDKYNAQYGN